MIAARKFFDLVPESTAAVNGGGQSVAPAVRTDRHETDCPDIYLARGGDVHTAQPQNGSRVEGRKSRAGEADVITAARPIVIQGILKVLGRDIPDPRAHANYLNTLSFSDLCARRDQLVREQLEQRKREELRRQPELTERPLKQSKLFSAGDAR